MTSTIRSARQDECDAVLSLYKHLHLDDDQPGEAARRQIWGSMTQHPGMHIIVVEVDERLVASCVICIIPNLTRGGSPYGVIENVVTHENYRRQGYGTAVVRAALRIAWTSGCYKVMLLSGRTDTGTYRFYEACGFARGEKTGFIARPLHQDS